MPGEKKPPTPHPTAPVAGARTYNPPPCECTTIYDRAPNSKEKAWYPRF